MRDQAEWGRVKKAIVLERFKPTQYGKQTVTFPCEDCKKEVQLEFVYTKNNTVDKLHAFQKLVEFDHKDNNNENNNKDNIQILCRRCHNKKTPTRNFWKKRIFW